MEDSCGLAGSLRRVLFFSCNNLHNRPGAAEPFGLSKVEACGGGRARHIRTWPRVGNAPVIVTIHLFYALRMKSGALLVVREPFTLETNQSLARYAGWGLLSILVHTRHVMRIDRGVWFGLASSLCMSISTQSPSGVEKKRIDFAKVNLIRRLTRQSLTDVSQCTPHNLHEKSFDVA